MHCINTVIENRQQTTKITRRVWASKTKNSCAAADFLNALQYHMQSLPTSVDVENMWKEWKCRFHAALDETAPRVTTTRSYKRRRCPWMTQELLHLIHKQKSLHRRIVKSTSRDAELIARHRALRNKTNNLYRQLRNSHFKNKLLLYRTSPRPLWSTIKYITNQQHSPLQIAASLADLSHHFESLLRQPGPYVTLPYGPDNLSSLHNFLPVTPSEVECLLAQLDPMKSSGPDLISPFELTVACRHISAQLATLFNESLATGTLPTEFKSGIISPILKPGKRDNSTPNSYRGISLTCVLSKVLEKIAHQQLESYFKTQGAYHEDQYGFRKGRSCADLLLGTIDDWMIAKDRKLSTAIVFIDLSKAFDNVQHDKLLLKLQKLGVGGMVLKWFHSYLCNRTQKVAVGNDSSPSFYCTKGVPQGSVLSPLLFNIYVSDLHDLAKQNNSTLRSFADDMTLYHSDISPVQASKSVSAAVSTLNNELMELGLPINIEKSAALYIHPSAPIRKVTPSTSTPTILLNGTPIKIVTEMRVLGVIVDNKLSWSPHVESVISKVCRKIGILQRNKHQLTHFARRLFYLAIIQPDLEYAAVSTVPFMSASLRGRLCSVWRRAVRCIAGADWQADVAPILKNHRLTHIEHRWALQIALVTRRCIQRSAPLTLCKKLTLTDHSHRTRGSGNSLRPFRPSSRPGTLSFSNRAPLLWNNLPPSIQQAPSTPSFKSNYLKYLLCSPNSAQHLELALGNPLC